MDRTQARTDCALMLGMMYELECSGKTDKNILQNCTSGFEVFQDHLLGKSDGIPKSPEWASEITGIPTDKIHSLTHELADNRTMIIMGWGMTTNSVRRAAALDGITLASMLGQIGIARRRRGHELPLFLPAAALSISAR